MAPKNKPYEQFGPYILFKKLDSDSLGELWRAGLVEGSQLGPTVALRRLTGGNREALVQAAAEAEPIVPQLSGATFVKNQVIGVINGTPFVAHDYAGGRSLRHIVDRARGGQGVTPNPIPIDQAIVVAEKVALSLATIADMKVQGSRLTHGALIPQFVWISDDGEIRVAGQMLGKGVIASIKDPKVAAEIGRYFPPEYQATGEQQKSSAVYGAGAILYLLVTGQEPPDPLNASAFSQAIRASKTMSGEPIPDDIRAILEKSLALDPANRYPAIADLKTALTGLAHGGKYSATTFNLAFYLSNLLKKEMESEAIDREKEQKVNVAPYVAAPPVPAGERVPVPAPTFGMTDEPEAKSKAPMAIAAVVALALIGGGVWYAVSSKPKPAANANITAGTPPPPPKPKIVSEPVVAATSTTAPVDPAAQKKAFEDAVQQQLQAEMMKLQTAYTQSLQKTQSKNAPVPTPATPASAPAGTPARPEERAPSAAALDESRRPAGTPQPAATASQPTAATPQVAQTTPVAPAPTAPAPSPSVHEGDVVEITELDSLPSPTSPIRPHYPPMAMKQRVQAVVIVTALISETGEVKDVKVLRGDERFGFNDEAVKAMKAAHFTPPMKDGKRVKTWRPQTISFTM